MTDVLTNETFTVSSFTTPVVIEAFAVWCPTCTRQQQEIKRLHGLDVNVTSVSVNVDPNEKAQIVKRHAMRQGFDWRYVVLPRKVTRSFVQSFGTGFVNPPTSPVVISCPNGSAAMLRTGVKPAAELKQAVEDTCDV